MDIVLRQLLRTSSGSAVEVIAYCFMPDHFHALVAGTSEGSNLHQFFRRFRQHSGFHHQSATGERLWQDGYFDRTLRKEDETFDVVSYILANTSRSSTRTHFARVDGVEPVDRKRHRDADAVGIMESDGIFR